jgi:hypothetical protein
LLRIVTNCDLAADCVPTKSILLKRVRLLAQYSRFIQTHWAMTAGTKAVVEDAKLEILDALPDDQSGHTHRLRDVPLDAFAGVAPVAFTLE